MASLNLTQDRPSFRIPRPSPPAKRPSDSRGAPPVNCDLYSGKPNYKAELTSQAELTSTIEPAALMMYAR